MDTARKREHAREQKRERKADEAARALDAVAEIARAESRDAGEYLRKTEVPGGGE